jgi:hypothetical protein
VTVRQKAIARVRDTTRELSDLCARNGLVRLERFLRAAEHQALLETLLNAAEQDQAAVSERPVKIRAAG